MDSAIKAQKSAWRTRSHIRAHLSSGAVLKQRLAKEAFRVPDDNWRNLLIELCNWVYSARSGLLLLDPTICSRLGTAEDISYTWRIAHLEAISPIEVIELFIQKIDQLIDIGKQQKQAWLSSSNTNRSQHYGKPTHKHPLNLPPFSS